MTGTREAQASAAGEKRRRRVFVAWSLVVAWAGVIWTLGGDGWSLSETNRLFSPVLDWLFDGVDGRTKWRIYIAVRKSAHFVEYAILALLTFRAALLSAPRNQLITAAWSALFLVALVATADEARQAFSSARSGSAYDVLIDVTGGAVAIAALLAISLRARRPTDAPTPP